MPKIASCLCAFGQVISDVKYHFLASAVMRLDEHADLARLDQLFSDMEARDRELLAADGFAPERISLDRKVEMRYQGQIHECQVDVPPAPSPPTRWTRCFALSMRATNSSTPMPNRTTWSNW
ncbi:hypothetical protein WJ970_04280 [Achromobacter xylosoxidans]